MGLDHSLILHSRDNRLGHLKFFSSKWAQKLLWWTKITHRSKQLSKSFLAQFDLCSKQLHVAQFENDSVVVNNFYRAIICTLESLSKIRKPPENSFEYNFAWAPPTRTWSIFHVPLVIFCWIMSWPFLLLSNE